MPYVGGIKRFSAPYQFRVPDATSTQDGVMTKEQVIELNSIAALSLNRQEHTLFVGEPIDPAVVPNGSAIAPYPTPQAAVAVADALGYEYVIFEVAPGDYTAAGTLTIPANMGCTFRSSLIGGATVSDIIIEGSADDQHQVSFFGFNTETIDFIGDPASIGIGIFVGVGNITGIPVSVTNSGNIIAALVCAGILNPSSLLTSVTIEGSVDLGSAGSFVASRADIKGAVTCAIYSSTESKNPAEINCSGSLVNIALAARDVGFPYGATVITFTGAAGEVNFDAISLLSFGLAGGQINNGAYDAPGFFARLLRASAATAVNLPVSVTADNTVTISGTTFADMVALAGFTITSAANAGDLLLVAGEGGSIEGFFAGLVAGEAQYAAGGVIIPESALAAYIAGAASGSWYRRIGFALNSTAIVPNFGEPQQVP